MRYLTEEQLKKLTPQRRAALLRRVQARVGKQIDPWFDFQPDQLSAEDAKLNDYRKQIHRMVREDRLSC